MKIDVQTLSKELFKDVVAIRRHLHAHPELSFQEKNTSLYIEGELKDHKIKYTKGWAGYGIVAEIKGKKKGNKIIALRGDMDALPIQEKNKISYKSTNEGVMHACGHDVHTSSLLGTAVILNQLRSHFGGTVRLIFQPGEEKLPGGASVMLKEGLFKKSKPSEIFGQHVHPPLEVGKIGICSGKYMASADEIYLTIHGKGGHAALPHNCIDPIIISAEVLSGIQQIVSRKSNPITPSVLSFGKINSEGGATNVIPNKVFIEGTFRTMDEKWRSEAHKLIYNYIKNTTLAHGAKFKLEIKKGYPCLINNKELCGRMKKYAIDYLGERNVVDLPIRMSSEDFAFFSHKIPACFYRLGTGNVKKGISSPVHTDTFNIDENALKISTGLMAYAALKTLGN